MCYAWENYGKKWQQRLINWLPGVLGNALSILSFSYCIYVMLKIGECLRLVPTIEWLLVAFFISVKLKLPCFQQ
jgi:hypothetical protein